MEQVLINAKSRETTKKGDIKRLRAEGKIPAVVYGKDIESKALTVEKRDLLTALSTSAGDNVLLNLRLDSGESVPAVFKDIQKDPIKNFFIHVDFHKIDLTEKIQVNVPLHIEGEPKGAQQGGIAQYQIREVEVECLPTQIPDYITIDVSDIDLNESINVGDLPLPEGSELLSDPDETVMSVVAPEPEVEEEEEEEVEGEEGEEADEGEEGEEADEGEES